MPGRPHRKTITSQERRLTFLYPVSSSTSSFKSSSCLLVAVRRADDSGRPGGSCDRKRT